MYVGVSTYGGQRLTSGTSLTSLHFIFYYIYSCVYVFVHCVLGGVDQRMIRGNQLSSDVGFWDQSNSGHQTSNFTARDSTH